MSVAKPGNPHGAPREDLVKITFKLDAETYGWLQQLEAEAGPNVRGRRSALLRLAIREKFERSRK